MKTLKDCVPGDEVLLFTRYGGHREKSQKYQIQVVTKVGRKLLYAGTPGMEHMRTFAYRIEDDGVINDNYGHSFIRTVDEHAAVLRRVDVLSALDALGLQPVPYKPSLELPTDTLEAVLACIRNTTKA